MDSFHHISRDDGNDGVVLFYIKRNFENQPKNSNLLLALALTMSSQ